MSSSMEDLDQLRKEISGKYSATDSEDESKHVKFDASTAKPQPEPPAKKGRLIDSLLGDDDEDLLQFEEEKKSTITINGVPLGTILYGLFLLSAFGAVIVAAYNHNEDDFATWVIKTFFPFLKDSLLPKK